MFTTYVGLIKYAAIYCGRSRPPVFLHRPEMWDNAGPLWDFIITDLKFKSELFTASH